MKKVLLVAAAAVACFGTVASAGPNAGGTLIAVSNGALWTGDGDPPPNYCGTSGVQVCEDGISRADNTQLPIVVNVLAAFDPGANPRLAAIVFGVQYPGNVFIVDALGCGDFELGTTGWPGSGTGVALTWDVAQTSTVIDVAYLGAYSYDGAGGAVQLIEHPTQGANFADDSIPAEVDEIAGLGAFGFDRDGLRPCPDAGDTPGACCDLETGICQITREEDCPPPFRFEGPGTVCDPNPCPQPATGACCFSDQSCQTRTETECGDLGGNYLGDGTTCDPNPCPNPVIESTWGGIKNTYR